MGTSPLWYDWFIEEQSDDEKQRFEEKPITEEEVQEYLE